MINIFVGITVYAELSNNLKFQKHITLFPTWQCWVVFTLGRLHFLMWSFRNQTSPILGLFHPKDLIPICIHEKKGQGLGEMPVGVYNRPGCNIRFSPTSLAMMWSCGHRRSWEDFQWCALEGQWIFMENQLCPCRSKIVTPKEKWKWEKFLKRA